MKTARIFYLRADRSRKMKCPFCGRDNTRVIDSRPSDDNNAIRRRRVCDVCGKRFTTYEKVETIPLIVIKKDNNREPYDRSKIEAGVLRACHKRPVSANGISRADRRSGDGYFFQGRKGDPTQRDRGAGHEQDEGSGCGCLCAVCFCLPRI